MDATQFFKQLSIDCQTMLKGAVALETGEASREDWYDELTSFASYLGNQRFKMVEEQEELLKGLALPTNFHRFMAGCLFSVFINEISKVSNSEEISPDETVEQIEVLIALCYGLYSNFMEKDSFPLIEEPILLIDEMETLFQQICEEQTKQMTTGKRSEG